MKGERADAAFAAYCQGAEDEREELIRKRLRRQGIIGADECVKIVK